jgi:epoxyqueuosine reductase
VCPWNRRTPQATEPEFEPLAGMNPVELAALLDLDEAAFRARFRHTPLARAKRTGILRNAAILLGNRPHPAAHASLLRALQDPDPTIRAACRWALARYPVTDR